MAVKNETRLVKVTTYLGGGQRSYTRRINALTTRQARMAELLHMVGDSITYQCEDGDAVEIELVGPYEHPWPDHAGHRVVGQWDVLVVAPTSVEADGTVFVHCDMQETADGSDGPTSLWCRDCDTDIETTARIEHL